LQILGRVTLGTILTAGGLIYYMAWKDRHPGEQLPHDPSKKVCTHSGEIEYILTLVQTIVVLGSGWAAMSFLKSLKTEEYNVVCWNYTITDPSFTNECRSSLAREIISFSRHSCRVSRSEQLIPAQSYSRRVISRATRLVVSTCMKERPWRLMSVIFYLATQYTNSASANR